LSKYLGLKTEKEKKSFQDDLERLNEKNKNKERIVYENIKINFERERKIISEIKLYSRITNTEVLNKFIENIKNEEEVNIDMYDVGYEIFNNKYIYMSDKFVNKMNIMKKVFEDFVIIMKQ